MLGVQKRNENEFTIVDVGRPPLALLQNCPAPERELHTVRDLLDLHLETRRALDECSTKIEVLKSRYYPE